MLQRLSGYERTKHRVNEEIDASNKAFEPEAGWENLSHWQLGSGMGRRYARISGDFNPIHLHPLVSRWFGFENQLFMACI